MMQIEKVIKIKAAMDNLMLVLADTNCTISVHNDSYDRTKLTVTDYGDEGGISFPLSAINSISARLHNEEDV